MPVPFRPAAGSEPVPRPIGAWSGEMPRGSPLVRILRDPFYSMGTGAAEAHSPAS
jgi:hypothetical protein